MTRLIVILAMLAIPATASAAVWHGHTVKARLVGQIDASPCPTASCLRGVVGVIVDGHDVRDHVVRCANPRHLRVLGFRQRRYALIHACGRNHWWRFR